MILLQCLVISCDTEKKYTLLFFLHKKWVQYSHRVGLPPTQSVIGVESHYITNPISHWTGIPSGLQPSGWITPSLLAHTHNSKASTPRHTMLKYAIDKHVNNQQGTCRSTDHYHIAHPIYHGIYLTYHYTITTSYIPGYRYNRSLRLTTSYIPGYRSNISLHHNILYHDTNLTNHYSITTSLIPWNIT